MKDFTNLKNIHSTQSNFITIKNSGNKLAKSVNTISNLNKDLNINITTGKITKINDNNENNKNKTKSSYKTNFSKQITGHKKEKSKCKNNIRYIIDYYSIY